MKNGEQTTSQNEWNIKSDAFEIIISSHERAENIFFFRLTSDLLYLVVRRSRSMVTKTFV